MRHRVFGMQQEFAENFGVGPIDVTVIPPQELRPIGEIQRRQPIPGNPRMRMMDRVVIVVQKQQGKRPSVLDHHGPCAGKIMGAMLQKRTDLQQRKAEIGAKRIGPDRHFANPRQPAQHHRQPEQMQPPGQPDPRVARPHRAKILDDQRVNPDGRTNRHAPQQGIVEPPRLLLPCRKAVPDFRVQIIRFRVVIGIGQNRVMVMRKMQILEPDIGDEQRHCR